MQIKPQPGFQTDFLASEADIVIGGGAAGAGKTFALIIEPLRHIDTPGFNAVFFRRTHKQIKSVGGLWETCHDIYPLLGAKSNESKSTFGFTNATFQFSHLQHEKNKYDHQGAEYCYLAFDELTHFSESQFFYLLSRNRSTSGIRPYCRATCNPDPESWVADFISWWIDEETGYPIDERSGKLRYFVRDEDQLVWGDTEEEVIEKCPHLFRDRLKDVKPMSVTFIPGDIYGNKILLTKDPGYLANLMSQSEEEQLRLLHGNWKIKIGGDLVINYMKLQDAFTNTFVKPGQRAMTADIAFWGSDDFTVGVWEGKRLIHYEIIEKSQPDEVEAKLKALANQYNVPRSRICYDADGVGSYLKGYLKGALNFNGNATPVKQKGQNQNYMNLKAQCYYLLGESINNDEYYFGKDPVLRRRLEHEYKAIKRDKPDADGKLRLIPKEQMKNILKGKSPDLMDMIMLREYIDLKAVKIRIHN